MDDETKRWLHDCVIPFVLATLFGIAFVGIVSLTNC